MTILSQMTASQRAEFYAAISSAAFTPAPMIYRTKADLSAVMVQDANAAAFAPIQGLPGTNIVVNPAELYQQMYGAGGALTESVCFMLTKYCTPAQRKAILTQVFGTDGFTTARIAMGTSDFTWRASSGYYTYCDDWDGQDTTMPTFSIQKDLEYIVPVLREVQAINPRVRFFAMPWSPPAKMKTTGSLLGKVAGTNSEFVGNATNYAALATYFLKFLQAYQALGIEIFAVAPQNEPMFGFGTYPGCYWSGAVLTAFIRVLGPKLAAGGFGGVRILSGDVNWNEALVKLSSEASATDTVSAPLLDQYAGPYTAGSAWHGYDTDGATDNSVLLTAVQDQLGHNVPGKEQHFTEYCTVTRSDPVTKDMAAMFGNIVMASTRYGAQSVTLWNLFLDANGLPTPAGTSTKPMAVLSTDGAATVTKNAGYVAMQHLAKALKPGARRCKSTTFALGRLGGDIMSVAFANADGSVGVVMFNGSANAKVASLTDGPSGLTVPVPLGAGEAVTVLYAGLNASTASQATGSTVAPNPIANLSVTANTGVANLSWPAATTSDPAGIGGYLIQRGSSSGQELATCGGVGPKATSFTDMDVNVGDTWYWKVTPFGAGGLAASAPEATATITASAPNAPVVTATPGNAYNTIALAGSPPASNGATITGYNIYRGTSAGGEGPTALATGQTLPYTDNTAANGTQYFYMVTAVNSAGESARSAEVSATPAVPVRPGAGKLVSDDMGKNSGGAFGTTPTDWSSTSYTYSPSGGPASATVTNHLTVLDPAGNATGSTIELKVANAASGYASVEGPTSAVPGTGNVTYSFYARGKSGGERIQLQVLDASHNNVAGNVQLTLTTSWQKYSTTAAISTGATKVALMQVGTAPNMVEDVFFDVCWANAT